MSDERLISEYHKYHLSSGVPVIKESISSFRCRLFFCGTFSFECWVSRSRVMTISLERIGKNALVIGARATKKHNNENHECGREWGEARDSLRRFRLPMLMVNARVSCERDMYYCRFSILWRREIQVFSRMSPKSGIFLTHRVILLYSQIRASVKKNVVQNTYYWSHQFTVST